MPCLADGLQYCAVACKASSIAPLTLTWLEHRLKVVEHEQARPISQELEQHGESRPLALRWYQLVRRQEANRACHPVASRECVAQASPVHTLEAQCCVLGQPRCECRLADAAHAEHRRQATALLHHPVAKGCQLFGTAHKADDIRRLAPVLAPLEATTLSRLESWRGRDHVGHFGRVCRRTLSEKPVEPHLVQ